MNRNHETPSARRAARRVATIMSTILLTLVTTLAGLVLTAPAAHSAEDFRYLCPVGGSYVQTYSQRATYKPGGGPYWLYVYYSKVEQKDCVVLRNRTGAARYTELTIKNCKTNGTGCRTNRDAGTFRTYASVAVATGTNRCVRITAKMQYGASDNYHTMKRGTGSC